MRLAALASLVTAGLITLAMGAVPMLSQADSHAASCSTCGKGKSATPSSCPHCEAGEECPHCDKGESCPHCKGAGHHGHHGHHGHQHKWGAHKWEYKCVRPRKQADAMNQQFKAMGDEGWRLEGADSGFWCFARMKPSK